jgi:hypothetical protein
MTTALQLNRTTLTIDGSVVLEKEDIMEFSPDELLDGVIGSKTYGDPVPVIPTEGPREFSVTVGAMSRGQRIMVELLNEYHINPQFHTFAFFDGGQTTVKYTDVMMSGARCSSGDTDVTYTYSFRGVKARVFVDQ